METSIKQSQHRGIQKRKAIPIVLAPVALTRRIMGSPSHVTQHPLGMASDGCSFAGAWGYFVTQSRHQCAVRSDGAPYILDTYTKNFVNPYPFTSSVLMFSLFPHFLILAYNL